MTEEYIGAEEAARILGVKRPTLYAYVSRGVLKSYRPGLKRARLYKRAEVEALVRLSRSDEPLRPRWIPLAAEWMPYV